MGVLINHSKGTKIVLSRNIKCLAKPITEILSSDSWEDKRCILMGGGPSIVDFDFSLIENELTIGVNKSFIKFPTNIVYCMDMGFYDKVSHDHPKNSKLKKLHQQWLEYKGIKVFLHRPKFKLDDSVYFVENISNIRLSFNLEDGIFGGNNSGFGALALAICLGATKIGLLGYSMKVDIKHRKTHWHDGYSHQDFDSMQKKLNKFKKPFQELAITIADAGIEVVNLNENSALDCFRKDSVTNFLR